MGELERDLREVGRELAFPPGPELALLVGERLRREAAPRAWRPRRRVLAIGLAVLALALAAALAVPAARTAILDLFRIGGVEIERVETVPTSPPGKRLDLGERVTLEEGRSRVRFAVALPGVLSEPAGVYYRGVPQGGALSLVYRTPAGVRVVLTQFRADSLPFIEKAIGPGTRVEQVLVDGLPGVWLAGSPHSLVYRDASGEIRQETRRLVGNVLLWEREGLTLRIEGRLRKEEALRIAESVT